MNDPRRPRRRDDWPSPDEIDRIMTRARIMRAEATAAWLGAAGRGIVRLAGNLAGRVGRGQTTRPAQSGTG